MAEEITGAEGKVDTGATGAEGKTAEELAAAEKLNEGKTPEEIAAAAKEKENEGKTPEEIAAEEKAAKDKENEGKTPEEIAAAEKAAKEKEEGKPEEGKYEKYNIPDDVVVNEEIEGKFNELAGKHKLSQENAQEFMDLAVENMKAVVTQQREAWDKVADQWVADIKADTEFGGDKFNETTERANRTMRNYGDKELGKFLVDSRFGDHKGLVKMFAKIDKALGEDYIEDGGPAGEKGKSAEDVLYPEQGK